MDKYPTRPNYIEEVYADFDQRTKLFCVFGTKSGFAYKTFADESEAVKYAKTINEKVRRLM